MPAPREAGPSRGEGRGPAPPPPKGQGLLPDPEGKGAGGRPRPAVAAAFVAPRYGDRDRRPRGPRRWRASLPLLGAGPCSRPLRADPGRPAPAEGPRPPRPRAPRGRPLRERAATLLLLLLQADVRGHWDGRALTLPAPRAPRPWRPRGSPLYRQPAPRHRSKQRFSPGRVAGAAEEHALTKQPRPQP